MTTQLRIQPATHTVKTAGMWCVLSLSNEGQSVRYLGSKPTSIQASAAFSTRNPRPEAEDTKAALD
jgi:hypothetical protein